MPNLGQTDGIPYELHTNVPLLVVALGPHKHDFGGLITDATDIVDGEGDDILARTMFAPATHTHTIADFTDKEAIRFTTART